MNSLDLSRFDTISFDCYGTLIDWESGILAALRPWRDRQAAPPTDAALLAAFGANERAVQSATPGLIYPQVLAEVLRRMSRDLGAEVSEDDAAAFGASVPDWPAFDDSHDALTRLAARFRLYVLSNVDRASFAGSQDRLGVTFTGVVTAQDVGAYKPDPRNFVAMIAKVEADGGTKAQHLHVGEALHHDVAPGQAAGLPVVWIDRRAGQDRDTRASGPERTDVTPDATFTSMQAFADAATEGAEA